MGTANFFPLQTSQSTDETLALKKIISVIFQSLSFKFLHSINLIDQVDLKTVWRRIYHGRSISAAFSQIDLQM